jgi:hypothetical protein
MTETETINPDELLIGAIDVHHHGYPEITFELRTRHDDDEELRVARDAGMSAIVFKSHMWPSIGRTYHLNRMVPGIAAIPSITLNPIVGGLSPMAVESAARQGAAFLFMPTWGAAHDVSRRGMSNHMRHLLKRTDIPGDGLRIVDESGRVKPEVVDCLAVAAEFGMAVASGHIAPRETVALTLAAKDQGIDTVLFQHPDSNSTAATRDEIREVARAGGTVELCALGLLPNFQRITMTEVLDIVGEITPAQCVMTTDYFFDWAPPASETLRMMAGTMLARGVSAADIRTMLCEVPRRLLGRSPSCPPMPTAAEGA